MNAKTILFFILLIPCFVRAQMVDNFSDGDFTGNPAWIGNTDHFIVNANKQLQLNHSGAATSILATQIMLADSMEWSFWVKLNFSPSDNNNVRIYLLADREDLTAPLNGYFIKLGENLSNDPIELFKQTGTTVLSLCRGTPALVANAFAVRIRVIHDKSGDWKIWADAAGGTNYHLEASANDATHTTGDWMGVLCTYTSSNAKNFFFDDFYAGEVVVDQEPPGVESLTWVHPAQLDVLFSEPVDKTTSENPVNYEVSQSIGNPSAASRDMQNAALVHLQFAASFASELTYQVKISGVRDLAGNLMQAITLPFSFHEVKQFDVLIHEIMADPDPAVGLPNQEYLELYNRSDFDLDLSGWKLTLGSTIKTFPQTTLPAKGFLILGAAAAQAEFAPYGAFVGFSSFSLVNTGTTLVLKESSGKIIHSVTYSDSWYENSFKKDGGWSLEMVDVLNPCSEASNWRPSKDLKGGTPGAVNSQTNQNPDLQNPVIHFVGVNSPTELLVVFSEKMDSASICNKNNYYIDQQVGTPAGVSAVAPDYRKVCIMLPVAIEEGKTYQLSVTGEVKDCVGNLVSASVSKRFGVPNAAEKNDLIINEILFAPKNGCQDFVEIYNRSGKILDLKEFSFSNFNSSTLEPEHPVNISDDSFLCFPNEYFAFTTDTAALNLFYPAQTPRNLVQVAKLPTMSNESGTIAIANKSGVLIDRFAYTGKMHYPLLTAVSGVSLERMNPQLPADDKNNWHSAAESVGFATPGYRNSQFLVAETEEKKDVILLSPDVFSPDNDGYNDVLAISYEFDEPDYSITITVYDASGRLVRNLCKNELCGTAAGTVYWDGLDNNHHKALIGRYIIQAECFNLKGNVKKYRKTTVLGGKI